MDLKRHLQLRHVFCLATGAMISSGIFVLPGLAHAEAGPAVVLSYLVAGLLAIPALLSVAEITTAMPKAGGDYFFFNRALGPAVGTIAGLLTWFSLSLKGAFAVVGMAALSRVVAAAAFDPFPGFEAIVGGSLTLVFVAVNLCGSKEAARLQVILVVGLLALMGVFVAFGLGPALSEQGIQRLHPFLPGGMKSLFFTAGLVFVSFGGLLNVASVAEEVDKPGRNIPLGMMLSLLIVCLLYAVIVFITGAVLDHETLHATRTPISDAAGVFLGRGGAIALGVGAFLAFVTTANGGILSASRYLLALAVTASCPRP